ncbi:MAG: alpha-aminoadipate/glutamate carrier protein LysW/ArgW [Nitrososphaerota archaeon]|nr:alpha-aminoadipate/glutamate carrier protein LysW/ArgW [Aigarchaeota archaeon]MDW8076243.1 alpha-aminoadipate/glutamate carrier protein LysW/ArgW [Nitrososphaerota archaeon]
MVRVACPICGGKLDIPEDSLPGELFEHEECGAHLELIINEGKFELKLAEEIAEDWGQ